VLRVHQQVQKQDASYKFQFIEADGTAQPSPARLVQNIYMGVCCELNRVIDVHACHRSINSIYNCIKKKVRSP
jgi:hypothetical protein